MPHKILVVDDDPGVRSVLTRHLSSAGYDVQAVADGQAGLEAIKKDLPALVLLDMQMPKMGGLEFLRAAKAVHPEVVVVMVSGVRDEEEARKSLELGAADYITKPIDFEYLVTSVKAQLANLEK